ncbi:cyanophycinase [Amycolatopsis sp. NPDC004625]|uniref:cyanophycinase n=1 Tax=Amycolatopsis sp. NPDC004625 TaxID=3154670 RepID=UPI0033AAD981
MLGRSTLGALSAALLVLVSATPASASAPAPRGSLVLVGGALADGNDAVYDEIIHRAGGSGARIGIITAASVPASQDPDAHDPAKCANSECNGAYYAALFKQHGAADAAWIPVDLDHRDAAESDAVAAQVRGMTGFFFGGGDQYRYVTTLLRGDRHTDSKVMAAIRARFRDGAVISGSSAGAQIASGPDMVTGGDSYEGLRDGSRPGYFDDPSVLGYLPAGGFGLLTSGLLDTHTGVQGREGRSLRLAADTGHDRVYALDENTALVVDHPRSPGETLRVLGEHGVTVLDLSHARPKARPCGWSITDVRYDYLTTGDRYTPTARAITPAPGSRPTTPADRTPVPANDDVFSSPRNPAGSPYSLLRTARALASNATTRATTAHTWETGPRFDVRIAKSRETGVWAKPGAVPPSVLGLRLDVGSAECTSRG